MRARLAVPKLKMDLKGMAISVKDEEEKDEVEARSLRSFEYVKVIPPKDRENQRCYLYGHISVTDKPSKPAVTLFNRSFDKPELLVLGNEEFSYLSLTGDSSERPLDATGHIYINVHLYEAEPIEEDEEDPDVEEDPYGGEEDDAIANVKNYMYDRGLFNETGAFLVMGRDGFMVEVAYGNIVGALVKVEVRINKDTSLPDGGNGDEENGESSKHMSIYGRITAHQRLSSGDRAEIALYSKDEDMPSSVPLGSPIPLDRNAVVTPIANGWLVIELELFSADTDCHHTNRQIVHELVPFTILHKKKTIITNKERTHTKQVLKDLFSVSITFL